MPAHRKPSEQLERAGAFRKNPNRRRKDLAGRGELPKSPPSHLRQVKGATEAWREIVATIPTGVATGSDRFIIERAAILLARSRTELAGFTSNHESQLRAYLGNLGLSPESRSRLGSGNGKDPKPNPFAEVGDPQKPQQPLGPRRVA